MKNIPLILSVLIIFMSCTSNSKRTNTKPDLPENTTSLKLNPHPFIPKLPDELRENSGLIYYDGLIWTINDSGGENKIYGFDFKGKIQKEIEIKGAENIDWEDIAQDEKCIYVGDFGNNYGMRENLKIYRVQKKDIGKKSKQKVDAKEIEFQYQDQKDFSFQHHTTPYDCEAITELNNSLYLFTKNWKNRTTSVYKLPAKRGKYKVFSIDSLNVTGLITGADISPDKTKLVLLGYKNFKPILWLFTDIKSDDLFSGTRTFIEMDSINQAQTEGICFLGNDSLLISCEENNYFNHQVFLFNLNTLEKNGTHSGK